MEYWELQSIPVGKYEEIDVFTLCLKGDLTNDESISQLPWEWI